MTAALAIKLCPACKETYAGGEVFCPVDATRLMTPSQAQTGLGNLDLRDPDDPLVGAILAGRYEVIRRIGEGGMGLVYEAMHMGIEKRVAVKVLRDDFSKRPEVVERFQLEAKSASRIGNAHIIDISDFGETPGGASYFVMEFLDGQDLADVLAASGTLDVNRAVYIVQQCCRALGAAQKKGVVHRDMKPENIFLTTRDEQLDFVKIVDFGIAKMNDIETEGAPGRKLTKTGMIFGTPEYMSPEQSAGKPADGRVDIYALGVILFECLTGRTPFVGDSFMGILTQHMFEEVPGLRDVNPAVDVSPELEMVIRRSLAKDPDERYTTMNDLSEALSAALAGRAEPTLTGFGAGPKPVRAGSRPVALAGTDDFQLGGSSPRRALWGALVALLLLVGVAGGIWAWRAVAVDETINDDPGRPMTDPNGRPQAAANDPAADPPVDPGAPAAGSEPTMAAVAALDPRAADPIDDPPAPTAPAPGMAVATLAAMVDVRVTSRPSGASVTADGGEGCSATPCTLHVASGSRLALRARRGRFVGTGARTVDADTTIHIVLRAQRAGHSTASTTNTTMTGSTHMSRGDLKIPDIFR